MNKKRKRIVRIFTPKKYFWGMVILAAGIVVFVTKAAMAGPYRDSAHGNAGYGVNRASIDAEFAQYATGNCAHCHEMHASIEGVEPSPGGGPAPNVVFANSFNTGRTLNTYQETDNFCFYCHSYAPGPQVKNQDYSTTFGGAAGGSGPQSILEAFNQASYHNLYDIWSFLSTNPTYSPWFAKRGNPCSGCHNPHLAKRNWDSIQPGFPLLSAISLPGISENLWGESEVMATYLSYEAPFTSVSTLLREPAGVGDQDGSNTPDYVGFCTNCHNPDNIIQSTTLIRELKKINWKDTGLNQNKHGALSRDGTSSLREPFLTAAATKSNFILSCLDCHEPHGSANTMLLRRRINGEDLEGIITSTDAMSYACKRCHTDDLAAAAGTSEANRWQYVHHVTAAAPYPLGNCIDCHDTADGSTPIACGNCHGHGMDDSLMGAAATGRITF